MTDSVAVTVVKACLPGTGCPAVKPVSITTIGVEPVIGAEDGSVIICPPASARYGKSAVGREQAKIFAFFLTWIALEHRTNDISATESRIAGQVMNGGKDLLRRQDSTAKTTRWIF